MARRLRFPVLVTVTLLASAPALAQDTPAPPAPGSAPAPAPAPAPESAPAAPAPTTAAPTAPATKAPAGAVVAKRKSVLVLDLEAVDVPESNVRVVNELLGQSMSRFDELEVITAADVRHMAEVSATKSMLGCDDATCLSQLAGDLGAEYVLYGSVGSLDGLMILQLNLFDAVNARASRRAKLQAESVRAVAEKLDAAVDDVVSPIATARAANAPGDFPYALVGGVTAATGLTLMAIGAIPLFTYADLQGQIAGAEDRFSAGDDAALDDARALQSQAAAANAEWTSLNGWLFTGGVALTLVGAGVAAASFALAPAPATEGAQ